MTIQGTTSKQDRDFIKRLGEEISIDAGWVLTWVTDNFAPEDIFDLDDLEDWAIGHGFIKPSD